MFNKLAKEINESARLKGFWDSTHFSEECLIHSKAMPETIKATKDAFIAQKLALIMSEIGEALEAMRKQDYEEGDYGLGIKDSFADELSDTIIRILDLCGELDIDIDAQIAWKLEYNASRPLKHGKEF
jgi:NTP pyrophosphatase (non-canonical NTP hydrolase)